MGYKGCPLNISILRSMDIDKKPVLYDFLRTKKGDGPKNLFLISAQTQFLHVVAVAQRVIGDDSLFGLSRGQFGVFTMGEPFAGCSTWVLNTRVL
jgi:hypothetical protein